MRVLTNNNMIDELEQMRNCDGKKIVDNIRHLFFIVEMMTENFNDFKNACHSIVDERNAIKTQPKSEKEKEKTYCQFARPFYNTIETYYAVTQHFAVIKNQNKSNTKFTAEYDKKWKENNLSSDETKFLNGMRSYIVHFQIPILTIRTAIFPCGQDTLFLLSKTTLLGFSGWTTQAKKFIKNYYIKTKPIKMPRCNQCEYSKLNAVGVVQCDGIYKECEDIEIAPIVERVVNNAIHFYNWLIMELANEYKDKISEYQSLIEQWNKSIS